MPSNCLHIYKARNPTKVVIRESMQTKKGGEEAAIKEFFQHIFEREKTEKN